MPDLNDGQTAAVRGSSGASHTLKNVAGIYSCSCPAWRNQSLSIDRRTCKHLREFRGEAAEAARVGTSDSPVRAVTKAAKPVAPALLLAHSWTGDVDPTGWWLSEKLDGVRAFWDGKQFLSRQGNPFHAPDWFTKTLPAKPLDGELWIGRKAFQRTVSIVRRQDGGEHWRDVRYLVFDAPGYGGRFEERLKFATDALVRKPVSHIQVLDHSPCRGIEHLREQLARIEQLGGEGVMLRQPGSKYEACRSNTLLKVKTFHDSEARVIEHLPGTGRHKGRLGAVLVELPNGIQFAVGSGFTDAQRNRPPAVGTTITFRYQELTDGGVPRFPTFVRIADATNLPLLAAGRRD